MPLPAGWTRDELYEMLASVSIEAAPPAELQGYLGEAFERFLLTWDLLRDTSGRALEIGANPYFTTVVLREFTDLTFTLTNNFGETTESSGRQHVTYKARDEVRDVDMDFHHVNVETSPLPFADNEFDVVIFCEVIEHLLIDPLQALSEIRRVLRPGGTLVLTTPNVARLENVARLVAGVNLYDPYSGYGPYGRHNREFTRHELVKLLEFAGFTPDSHFTADVNQHFAAELVDVRMLTALIADNRLNDLGQYLFCRATKQGLPRSGRPSELFRSFAADEIVTWD